MAELLTDSFHHRDGYQRLYADIARSGGVPRALREALGEARGKLHVRDHASGLNGRGEPSGSVRPRGAGYGG